MMNRILLLVTLTANMIICRGNPTRNEIPERVSGQSFMETRGNGEETNTGKSAYRHSHTGYDLPEPAKEYPYWPGYRCTPLEMIRPQPWREHEDIIEGWDWSLPPWVKPSPRSLIGLQRIIGLNRDFKPVKLHFPANSVAILWVRWREIEPEEGIYRFDLVKKRIEQAKRAGWEVILRILTCSKSRGSDKKALNRGDAPLWLEKYHIRMLPQKNKGSNLNFDPADPEFHKRYIKLIDELGRSGIPQMVKAAYVGYASPAFGDEGIGPHGQNPDHFPHVRERLDAFARAFMGMEYKVFMGGPSEYGFNKGFGIRRGFVEMYLYEIPDKNLGQYLDENGYLCVDEDSPILRRNCFNGEVNEEYGKEWATERTGFRYGKTTDGFPYRYFCSNLRLLQMRCTYVHNKETLIPEMLPFVALELGRTVDDAPDVWCALRESYIRVETVAKFDWTGRTFTKQEKKEGVPVKNFERWLYQRDRKGFETVAVKRINHPYRMWMVQKGKSYDCIARKGRRIGLNIDPRWLKGKFADVAVKVTYFDEKAGKFYLKFNTIHGSVQRPIALTGDGKLKTATVLIDGFSTKKEPSSYHLIIEGEGIDVVIAFVRIIKRNREQ